MRLLAASNRRIHSSERLLLAHNLRAADALHLQLALELHGQLYAVGDRLLFFGADHRLLRAAQDEGLTTFNPETGTEDQLAALLAA